MMMISQQTTLLFALLAGVALSLSNDQVNPQRSLQGHAHDDLVESFLWSGMFHLTPGSVYNLTVKLPEPGADPHEGLFVV